MHLRRYFPIGAVLIFLVFVSSLWAGLSNTPWPKFRHDEYNSGRSPYVGPSSPALKWKIQTGGPIRSSPSIGYKVDSLWNRYAGKYWTVYVGSDDRWIYGIQDRGYRANHFERWPLGPSTPTGPIWSSPALNDIDFPFHIGSQDSNLWTMSQLGGGAGVLWWKLPTHGCIESSPAICDTQVYVGSDDGYLRSVHFSGHVVWSYNVGSPIKSSPCVPCDVDAFVGADDGYLYCVRIFTPGAGSLVCRYPTGGMVRSSPAVGNGYFPEVVVYVGSDDGYIYSILFNLLTSNCYLNWRYPTGGPVRSSPALLDVDDDGFFEAVVVGSDDGYVYAINSFAGGTLRWRYPAGGPTGAKVRSSPAVDSLNNVYVGSDDGYLYALEGDSGKLIWSYFLGDTIRFSPSIGPDSTIYVGADDGYIYAINQCVSGDANGDGIWNASDVVYLINYLFISGPPPVPLQAGDANCNGIINAADVVYLINYLFIGGPPPCPC